MLRRPERSPTIAHLILQRGENAVRHGIASRIEPGTVDLRFSWTDVASVLESWTWSRSDHRTAREPAGRRADGHFAPSEHRTARSIVQIENQVQLENPSRVGVLVRISLPYRRADNIERSGQ